MLLTYIPRHAWWRCGLVALLFSRSFVRVTNKGHNTTSNHNYARHALVAALITRCICEQEYKRSDRILATGKQSAVFITYSVCASLSHAGGEPEEDVIRLFENNDIVVESANPDHSDHALVHCHGGPTQSDDIAF